MHTFKDKSLEYLKTTSQNINLLTMKSLFRGTLISINGSHFYFALMIYSRPLLNGSIRFSEKSTWSIRPWSARRIGHRCQSGRKIGILIQYFLYSFLPQT